MKLLFFFVIFASSLNAQRIITIRIDTLTGIPVDSTALFSPVPFDSYEEDMNKPDTSFQLVDKKYYQKIAVTRDTIYLKSDDNQGFIRLINFPDTIRLNNFSVFHTVTSDSVFFNKGVWKVKNDVRLFPIFSSEHKSYVKEKSSPNLAPPPDYSLTINGKVYTPVFNLVRTDELQISSGHGRWSKGLFGRRKKLRRKHFYMHFTEVTVANHWIAEIDLEK